MIDKKPSIEITVGSRKYPLTETAAGLRDQIRSTLDPTAHAAVDELVAEVYHRAEFAGYVKGRRGETLGQTDFG